MSSDITAIELKYNQFIEKAVALKSVWGLKGKSGWANSHSAGDNEVDVIPFWSERANAKVCARDDWKGFLPVEIMLNEFLESWCMEMAEGEALAGINWDANLLGLETDALQLAIDILNKLQSINSAITFKNYGSISDFLADISDETSSL
jgi:hypothetical protein